MSNDFFFNVFFPDTRRKKPEGDDWILFFLVLFILAALFILNSCNDSHACNLQSKESIDLPQWRNTPFSKRVIEATLFP